MRRKLMDLMNQRATKLKEAENALSENKKDIYDAAMVQIGNMNSEITQLQNLIAEQDRKFNPVTESELRDMAEERGNQLITNHEITFTASEMRTMLNAVTLATGTLAMPTGTGTEIHDPAGTQVSSIVDQVRVVDLTGLSSYSEPYVKTELEANGGKVEDTSGTARGETDPAFRSAEIKPYELTTTSYIDRNTARLTPVNYYAKVRDMAVRAMRRKLAGLIVTGDATESPTFFGIVNAKNSKGESICADLKIKAINENSLDELYFAYGTDDAIGANARILMTKKNLQAFGALRGAQEKQRLIKIKPDAGNPNSGVMENGGVIIPYTLNGKVEDTKLLYGDPFNFEVGFFGEYTVRIDESVKATERLIAVLGDAMVGGNVIVEKGFVVGTVGAGV